MKSFVRLLVVSIGLGLLGFAMSLVPQKNANGTIPLPVNVTNPALAATQSGTWNVGITGTPTVNLNGSPQVTLASGASVEVANAATQPVPALNVDEPSTYPVTQRLCSDNPNGQTDFSCASIGSPTTTFAVPTSVAGKTVRRLVVEFFSGTCTYNSTTNPVDAVTLKPAGNPYIHHYFALLGVLDQAGRVTFGSATKIYFDPGDSVVLELSLRDAGTPLLCVGSISGYLATQ